MASVRIHEGLLVQHDRDAVLKLLVDSFPGEQEKLAAHFAQCLEKWQNQTHVLISLGTEVVGYQLLLSKTLLYHGDSYSLCGMSYMAITPRYQNSEISLTLKRETLAITKRFDVAMGFARRVMDNYWYSYGFTGFTNFPDITIKATQFPRKRQPGLSIRLVEPQDINILKSLQHEYLPHQSFRIFRDAEAWEQRIKWQNQSDKQLLVATLEGIAIGYFIIRDSTVLECEFTSSTICMIIPATALLVEHLEITAVRFNIPSSNFIALQLRSLSHELCQRFCYEGGHFLRLINPIQFITKILIHRLTDLRSQGISINQALRLGNLKIDLSFSPPLVGTVDGAPIDRKIELLILGVEVAVDSTHPELCRLLFPVTAPSISELDQF